MTGRLAFPLSLGLFLVMVAASVAGVRVKLEDVPKPAVKAVQDRFPKATINYVDKELTGHFEFALKEGERQFDVGVKADGTLLNIKEGIAEAQVPKAVKEGLLKKYADVTIIETEKVTVLDGKKEKVTYEIKIKSKDKTLEVVVDEAGKVVGE